MTYIFRSYVVCSFYMFGIIWIIQCLQYPGFAAVDPGQFVELHRRHSNAMAVLVGPVMVLELVSVLVLARSFEAFWLAQAAMTIALWGLTFWVSVPIHNELATGFQPELIGELARTNWPRTLFWTVKAVMLVTMKKWVA